MVREEREGSNKKKEMERVADKRVAAPLSKILGSMHSYECSHLPASEADATPHTLLMHTSHIHLYIVRARYAPKKKGTRIK